MGEGWGEGARLKLSQKLLLFVLAAAVVPLAFAGFWLLREAERELAVRLEREQRERSVGILLHDSLSFPW